jgi:hypothetical protein
MSQIRDLLPSLHALAGCRHLTSLSLMDATPASAGDEDAMAVNPVCLLPGWVVPPVDLTPQAPGPPCPTPHAPTPPPPTANPTLHTGTTHTRCSHTCTPQTALPTPCSHISLLPSGTPTQCLTRARG